MRLVPGAVVIGMSFLGWSASAQEVARPTEAEVRAVLEASEVEHLLVSLSQEAAKALVDVGPTLDGPTRSRIGAALADAFSLDRLYPRVTTLVREGSDPTQLAALSDWLLSEESRAIRAKMNPDAMPISFQAYAEHLKTNPAPRERFQLVARFVYAQRASEFFVLTADSLRSSIERIVDEAAKPRRAVRVELTSQQEQNRLEDVNITSFIAFMRRFEPLSDAEALRMVEAYESASGQWWLATYSDAVLAAIGAAAETAGAALR